MALNLGTAFVTIEPDTKGFGKDVGKEIEQELGPAVDRVNSKIGSMGTALKGVGIAVAGAGITKFFKGAIDAATDVNEQVSKAGVVFGKSAEKVLAFGENAAKSIGSSNREALTAAGTFGNLLKSTGIAADAAADMSINMVQLAGDLASFNNVPTADALDAIRSGLVGETEPLKRFAVNLNEATLKAKAMELGLSDGKGTLDANAKAQAAYAIILDQTTDAQGDYARTADSLANRQRTLTALMDDAKATIGQALLPVMKEFVGIATEALPALTGVATSIANIAAAAGSALAPIAGLVGSFAGTDMGQQAIMAGLLAIGISKIGASSLVSAEGLAKLKTSMMAVEPVSVAFALGLAAIVQEYSRQQAASAANKARHEAMMKAFDEQAPLTSMNDKLGQLVKTLGQVAPAGQGAAEAVTDTASAMEIAAQLTESDRKNLERYGITQQQVADAINQGGGTYDVLRKRIEEVTEARKREMPFLSGSIKGGADWINHQEQAIKTLEALQEAQEASSQGRIAEAEANLQSAVSAGLLTQAWLDQEKAARGGATTEEAWLQIQEQAVPILQARKAEQDALAASMDAASTSDEEWATAVAEARKKVADADKKAMDSAADLAVEYGLSQDAALRMAEANDLTKDATDRRSAAEKELKDALDKVTESQEQYLFTVGGAQATVDDTTKSTRELVKSLKDGADAAGRSSEAFQGNSDQAINNRDALQTVRERALDVIEGFDKLGYTAEQAAAGQQQLAQDMYDTAIQAGATEDEANAVRDAINGIPIKHDTDIKAQADIDQANKDLNYAARERDAVISVSLKAVGVSDELLTAVRSGKLTYNATGAMIPHTPGGQLAVVGEGAHDEAIVPMGPNFAANLARIVGPKRMAEVQGAAGNGQPVINISFANGPTSAFEAQHLGRIAGESAARALAHRQMVTSMRVG